MTSFQRISQGLAGLAAVGALASCMTTAKPRKPMSPEALFKFARPKVVELVTPISSKGVKDLKKYGGLTDADFNDELGFCTGFIVAKDVVMTAHHCVQGFVDVMTGYVIRTHDKKNHKIKRILGIDVKHDYALLEVGGIAKYGVLPITTKTVIGQKVFTIGNVLGEGIAIRDGLVSSVTKDPNDPTVSFLRFSAAASPGNSGGPLVNSLGEVVALVFATANRSENFNVGALHSDLADGLKRYGNDRSKKTVALDSKDHHYYRPSEQLMFLRVPVPPQWMDDPAAERRLESLRAELSVPAKPNDYVGQTAKGVNVAVRQARDELKAMAAKNAEKDDKKKSRRGLGGSGERSWMAVPTAAMPLVIPAQVTRDFSLLELTPDKKRTVPRMGLLAPPLSLESDIPPILLALLGAMGGEGKEMLAAMPKQQAWSLTAALQPTRPEKLAALKLGPDDVFASSVARHPRTPVQMMAYRPWIFVKTKLAAPGGDWSKTRTPNAKEIQAAIVGDQGLEADSAHTLVRPKARREFTLKSLDEKARKDTVTDPFGRKWTVLHWELFDQFRMEAYCLPLPQGWSCLTSVTPSTDLPLHAVVRQNTADFLLTPVLAQPTFWDTSALVDFTKRGLHQNDPLMRDIEIARAADGSVSARLKTLGVELAVPTGWVASSVRLTSGLQKIGTATPRWLGLGFEAVIQGQGGAQMLCGAGVDLPNTNASHLLHVERLRAAHTGKGKLNSLKIPEERLFAQAVKSKAGDMTVTGWCAPLAVSYGGAVRVRYDDLKPMAVKHRVL